MLTVRDILDRKGRRVWSVAPEDTVFQALELMSERHVGALIVQDGPDLEGVVSERDYARKVVLAGRSSRATTVGEIMTSRVFYVSATNTIEECMALMTERSVRHLPVMDESHLDGVVSIGDVVKARISHQEFIIEQLEHFIAGR
jgi:CBS domain-containing protein